MLKQKFREIAQLCEAVIFFLFVTTKISWNPNLKTASVPDRVLSWSNIYFAFPPVVVERHRYGPVGWNNARYGFNVSDLNISLAQMKQVLMQVWEFGESTR